MEIVEKYRELIIKDLFNINTFSNCWGIAWESKINQIIGEKLTEEKLFIIGDTLRDIFFSTNEGERGQGDVSSAGTGWECLVAWYLNLGLIGTRTVIVKPKKDFNIESIKNALTVNYESFASNSESDLIAITFPKENEICYNYEYLNTLNSTLSIAEQLNKIDGISTKNIRDNLERIVSDNFSKIKINVIQCKTNWNDNAQIPMAWDMIYAANSFKGRDISIGTNDVSIFKLKEFKYSFVTVPTQKDLEKITPKSTHVLRVCRLSGHNFWGNPTKENVAYSINEFFKLNYKESYKEKNFGERIEENSYSYFGINK